MTKKTLLLLSCMALAAPSVLPSLSPLMAQGQQVTGLNLTRVEIPGDNGTEVFSKMANGEWVQFGGRGEVRFRFVETGRDATSVYLHDLSRNFKMQMDVSDRSLSFRDANGQKAVFATMSAMAASPVQAAQQRPAPAPVQAVRPQPAPPPTQAPAADDGEFDPFADPADTAPSAATPAPRSNRDIITGAANQRPAFTQPGNGGGAAPVASKGPSFDGQWVAEGEVAKESGDGVATAVNWTFREALWITTADDGSITIHFDANPAGSVTLRKTGEGQYSGSGYTASFAIIDKKNIRLELLGGGTSRDYNISTVPSGAKLSRSRIKPETDDEIDTFTAGNLVPRFNDMFLSYRNEKMDLFNAGRGAGPRIFKTPGAQDFSVESNLQSKTIPYGLRGQEIRRTEGNQLESVITNMASFEKSMSLNFGLSGSFKGATFAAEATREESKGAERSDGTTKAYGLARAEVYALFLDKPNMVLDPGFKFDILRLADGVISAQQFRIKYGTAYANAIHYGGIGKNQRTVTTEEFKKWSKESTSYKQEGGFDGGPAASLKSKGGLTMASGDAKGGTSMFSKETWSSVGGSGSMTSNGWNVDERNSVPIRYDLRPLSELISPIFLGEEWSSPKRAGLLNARTQLDNEINSYLLTQPKPDDRLIGPAVYRVTFHSLQCLNNGDDGKGDAKLYGNISAKLMGLEGEVNLSLLDASEDSPQTVSCNGGAEFPINRTEFITSARGGGDTNKFGRFKIVATDVFEYDATAVDYDEQVYSPSKFQNFPGTAIIDITKPQVPIEVVLREWRADQPRTDIEGTQLSGGEYAPQLRIRASFQQIQ